MVLQCASDQGGPRKEFFRLVLSAVKEKYFDKGLREHLAQDYVTVGKIMGKSNYWYDYRIYTATELIYFYILVVHFAGLNVISLLITRFRDVDCAFCCNVVLSKFSPYEPNIILHPNFTLKQNQ